MKRSVHAALMGDGPDRNSSNGHLLLRIWVTTAAVLFGFSTLWSFATPLNAPNDEGAHVLRAASVVRGQILGSPLTPAMAHDFLGKPGPGYLGQAGARSILECLVWKRLAGVKGAAALNTCVKPITVVTVPRAFVNWSLPEPCFTVDSHPDTCPVHLNGSNQPERAVDYEGRFPPLYYAIVGLPSLLSQSDAGVYMMRLVSGGLVAVLLGLALAMAATWSYSKMLFLSVAVAASPIVLVYGSAVNPSGLEMAAAVCTWTGALLLVLEHFKRPPTGLIFATAGVSVVLVLSRPLSALWLAIIAVFVTLLRPASVRTLAADRRVRIGFGCVAGASFVAVAYVFWAQALTIMPIGFVPSRTPEWKLLEQAFGQSRTWFNQFSGGFGWEATSPPLIGRLLLALAICAVVAAGFLTAGLRRMLVLTTLIATAALLPPLIEVSQVRNLGFDWFARYSYSLYCGVIIVAGAIIRTVPLRPTAETASRLKSVRWFAILVACCVAASQTVDLLWAIRRYSVGLSGPLDVFRHISGEFVPPVPLPILVGGAVVLGCVYGGLIDSICSRPQCLWRRTHNSRSTSALNPTERPADVRVSH